MKKYIINKEYEKYAPTMACDIAERVVYFLNNGDYEDLDMAIYNEIDSALIYFDDQWEVLKIYCIPQDADFYKACECLFEDIYNLIEEVEE